MDLTDDQYKQVLRYVNSEMDSTEKKAFEATLSENMSLKYEVELYKEIKAAAKSIQQKFGNINEDTSIEKKNEEDVLQMIKKARKNWERSNEVDRRLQYTMAIGEVRNLSPEEFLNLKPIAEEPMFGIENRDSKKSGKEGIEMKNMSRFGTLAAALIIGFILLAINFWNTRNQKNILKAALSTKKANSQAVATNRKIDSVGFGLPQINPKSRARDNLSSSDSISHSKIRFKSTNKQRRLAEQQLFARNFEMDQLPAQIPEPLEDPSTLYKAKRNKEAIPQYKNLLAELDDAKNSEVVLRSNDGKELITFYTHFYLAQSYMAINDMSNAIKELENADKIMPGKIWKNKIRWYMALACLKIGQIETAQRLLKEIDNDDQADTYTQKAVKLMLELRNLEEYMQHIQLRIHRLEKE